MDEKTKPKRAATDNPWYRLATLHGEPTDSDDEVATKDRVTWNRWMASRIPDDLKAALLKKAGHKPEELTPFPDDELRSIGSQVGVSVEPSAQIDFSDIEFDAFYAQWFIFPGAYFARATFNDMPYFGHATFSDDAVFASATFSGDFSLATFSGIADFGSATFSGDAFFNSATFSGDAYFDRATFGRDAFFTNAEMKGVTAFDNAIFKSPPECSNAILHEGTTWHDVRWPSTPSDVTRARAFLGAYARLKMEMDRLKKHSDELDFFALEQQCRRVVDGFWKGLPIAIYGLVSDYGRSYVRPLGLLFATVLVGTIIFAAHEGGFWMPLFGYVRKAAGISFANTLSLLGKPLLRADVVLAEYPDWLKAVATIQTILGIAFLFLFGLGIRNRFRMK